MVRISLVPGRRRLTFQATDFLMEAIEEFLESGAKAAKIGSCVIKIATATELLLKEKLEKICPALVLETIDDSALQVAKIHNLGNQMLNAKELEKVEIKTASFPKLLNRAGKFFDLAGSRSHLSTLHNIRNELVHHRGTVDIADVNLLLIERIFPFLEQFTKGDPSLKLRLKPEMWKRLKQLAESSADVVTTEIAKRIGHFAERAEELSSKRVGLLLDASPEIVNDEKIVEEGLLCPACSNRSLIAFSGWEVETDETGRPYAGWPYSVMRCKVCGLILDPDEILLVLDHFDRFLGKGQEEEKKKWEQAIEEPDNSDYRE